MAGGFLIFIVGRPVKRAAFFWLLATKESIMVDSLFFIFKKGEIFS